MRISGHIFDIEERKVFPGVIEFEGKTITSIQQTNEPVSDQYILPGFVDAHVHIESSMLVPTEFARMAVVHGTVATVSDPHEIGNVLGLKGVEFMIENGKKSNFKFYFGAPSCVPATTFETAGAVIDPDDVEYLLKKDEIKYLAEMMNWPGVLFKDEIVMKKLALAKKYGKVIDGHAPGLKGEQAKNYISEGISTDHECFTEEEARGKLELGMKVQIREGSAAKNYEALIGLLPEYYENMMFCSDDKHPDSLEEGHLNQLVKRSLANGYDLFNILQMACINPVKHYNLEVGLLKKGDPADFIVIDNPKDFNILQTWINGEMVAENGESKLKYIPSEHPNNFNTSLKTAEQFQVKNTSDKISVIEVLDGELITNRLDLKAKVVDGLNVSDLDEDILKISVINRYQEAEPAVAFIKNFGLKKGAIASSVGHDSHNIICVGVDDASITKAVNIIIESKGGICGVYDNQQKVIPLPVAGLMTDADGYQVSKDYTELDQLVKREMGSTLTSPFMSLSFMALLVIPALKLSDLGLFDGEKFEFIS